MMKAGKEYHFSIGGEGDLLRQQQEGMKKST